VRWPIIPAVVFILHCGGAAANGSPADRLSALEKAPERPAEGIQDNSFLIEEAYNQEAGVVQHILNIVHRANRHAGAKSDEFSFVFTQEWPAFSQTHQLSYTAPYTFLEEEGRSWLRFDDAVRSMLEQGGIR